MAAPPPPPDQITFDDINAHGLALEAACPRCGDWRLIENPEPYPGFRPQRPLAELFTGGKVICAGHRLPADRMRVLADYRMGGAEVVVAEWR